MLENIKIVPIGDVEIEEITALWNVSFKDAYLNSAFSLDIVSSQKNLISGIDTSASFAAIIDGALIGVVLSYSDYKHENDSAWHTMFPGWIGALFVQKDNQRQGVAKQLLNTAESAHKRKGRMLLLAGGGEGSSNLFPGIEEGLVAGNKLFEQAGYVPVRRTCYVELDVKNWVEPEVVSQKRSKLGEDGITIVPMAKDLTVEYMQYSALAGGDAGFSELPGKLSGIFVAMDGNKIIGEVHGVGVGSKGNGIFSGIQVLDDYRNRGIGKQLLISAILFTREQGSEIMQLWTRPMTADRFYVPIGFKIAMNYDVYGKTLQQDILSEDWIARFRHL